IQTQVVEVLHTRAHRRAEAQLFFACAARTPRNHEAVLLGVESLVVCELIAGGAQRLGLLIFAVDFLEAPDIPVIRRELRSNPGDAVPRAQAVATGEEASTHEALRQHIPGHDAHAAPWCVVNFDPLARVYRRLPRLYRLRALC